MDGKTLELAGELSPPVRVKRGTYFRQVFPLALPPWQPPAKAAASPLRSPQSI